MIALARWTKATSTISMAQMLSRSSRPAAVPRTMASMVLEATFATSDPLAAGALIDALRHHDQADEDGGWRPHHRGDHEMCRGVRDERAEQGGVDHQNRA